MSCRASPLLKIRVFLENLEIYMEINAPPYGGFVLCKKNGEKDFPA